MTGSSRYPLSVDEAAPGRAVRKRLRSAQQGGGAPIAYLGRVLLPLPDTLKQQSRYTIRAGDRIDNLAASLLGNPLLYWMLLEANGLSDPAALCAVPGRSIVVPAAVGRSNDPFDAPRAARRTSAAAPASRTGDDEETP